MCGLSGTLQWGVAWALARTQVLGASGELPVQLSKPNWFKSGLVRSFLPKKPHFTPARSRGTLALLLPSSPTLFAAASATNTVDQAFLYCWQTSPTALWSFRCCCPQLSPLSLLLSATTLAVVVAVHSFHRYRYYRSQRYHNYLKLILHRRCYLPLLLLTFFSPHSNSK